MLNRKSDIGNREPYSVLLIGFGNPGRVDDGLGPALAQAIEALALPAVAVETDYQLNLEHAADIAQHDLVIFADAHLGGPEPFGLQRIRPQQGPPSRSQATALRFTTHWVEPQSVLDLARQLFRAAPEAYVLGIRGYRFDDFGESLSPAAQRNLQAAVHFLSHALRCRDPRAALRRHVPIHAPQPS